MTNPTPQGEKDPLQHKTWMQQHKQDVQQDNLSLRNKLNLAFMILAFAAVASYLWVPMPLSKILYYTLGFAAVIIKMIEVVMRMKAQKKK